MGVREGGEFRIIIFVVGLIGKRGIFFEMGNIIGKINYFLDLLDFDEFVVYFG